MADRDKSATDGGALPDGSVATAPGLYRWVAASHAALLLELMVVNGLVGIGAPPEDYVDSFSPKNEDKTLQDFEDTIQITVPESKEFGAGAFDRRREIEFQSFIEIFHRLLGSGLMRVDELVQRTIEHQINQQAYLFAESTRLDSDRIRRLVEQSKKRGYLIEKGPWLSVPLDYRRQ